MRDHTVFYIFPKLSPDFRSDQPRCTILQTERRARRMHADGQTIGKRKNFHSWPLWFVRNSSSESDRPENSCNAQSTSETINAMFLGLFLAIKQINHVPSFHESEYTSVWVIFRGFRGGFPRVTDGAEDQIEFATEDYQSWLIFLKPRSSLFLAVLAGSKSPGSHQISRFPVG